MRARQARRRWVHLWQAINLRFSSSLTRRIVVLNLGGLVVLLLGLLYLNQFRAGLIDARIESLRTQAQIIAAALASSASVDTGSITLDPDKLLQMAPGESENIDSRSVLEFSLNPEIIAPVLRRLITPTQTRAQIYDREGFLLVDSSALYNGRVQRSDLSSSSSGWLEDSLSRLQHWIWGPPLPQIVVEFPSENGKSNPEVARALDGISQSNVRLNARGQTVISIAIPIQRFRIVRGALLMSTQGGALDTIIAGDRWAIIRIFLVAAAVMLLLSLMLASTIAEPIRRLSKAAERVRRGIKSRQQIPDYTDRADEIGHLSGSLREMTNALYLRIEAIESFAADVAHELKNPLTSLRSAVETLPRAKSEESRLRLMEVIQHDVRRLDRLISDISDASRLDAEMARIDMEPVDLSVLLRTVTGLANDFAGEGRAKVVLDQLPGPAFIAGGHDSRLAQVLNNLIDNARSFSPAGGIVKVTLRPAFGTTKLGRREGYEIIVDDEGPGIPEHALERIFERFYTDRPSQGFGQNSGLGLSISRQIVEAHQGFILASNRIGDPALGSPIVGARFIVWLSKTL